MRSSCNLQHASTDFVSFICTDLDHTMRRCIMLQNLKPYRTFTVKSLKNNYFRPERNN